MKIIGRNLHYVLFVILLVFSLNVSGQISQQEYMQALRVQLDELDKNTPLDLGGPSVLISTRLDYSNKCVVNKYDVKQSKDADLSISIYSKSVLAQSAKNEMLNLIRKNTLLQEPYQYGIGAKFIYFYKGKLAYEFEISPNEALRKY